MVQLTNEQLLSLQEQLARLMYETLCSDHSTTQVVVWYSQSIANKAETETKTLQFVIIDDALNNAAVFGEQLDMTDIINKPFKEDYLQQYAFSLRGVAMQNLDELDFVVSHWLQVWLLNNQSLVDYLYNIKNQ